MGILIQVLLVLCLSLEIGAAGQEDTNPVLSIKQGQLQGKTVNVKETDRDVHAFFGIPFAKPPVGPLRFAPPQKAEPWSGIREATQYPPMCLQNIAQMEELIKLLKAEFKMPSISEDCLYLNVFVPANREKNTKLPVMVFIHGGGLIMGGASMFDGSALCAHENVIIVSLQYRLGVLGFYSTGDEQAPGNFGFLDQVASLQWVQENIEYFGGNPRSVTIFGESAGGLSVAAHVLSPLSKGLFHRAISESGVAILPGLVANKVEEVLFFRNILANISGCGSSDSCKMVDCLKKKSEDEIVAIIKAAPLLVLPASVDGVFFPKPAEEILTAKESNRVPYLLGINNHEFGWILPGGMNITGITEGMDMDRVQTILRSFPLFTALSEFLPLISDEYFGDTDDPLEIRDRFLDLCGDIVFVMPTIKTAKYHRDSGLPVFFYEFGHRPSMYHGSKPNFVKADHGDELLFVLGAPFYDSDVLLKGNATDEEKDLSRTMMKYWTNFARNGNPNGPGLVEWPEYDEEEDYLEIKLKQTSAKKLKKDKTEFWMKTLPDKIQKTRQEKGEHREL
ncbi:fatty acyl-CoA hydrolase precursor, medium chain-like isoform 2-T2 [Discoglossus pictus]